jgi:hypothetical protein
MIGDMESKTDRNQDDLRQDDGSRCHGFPLDWLPDPAVSLWRHPTVQYVVALLE